MKQKKWLCVLLALLLLLSGCGKKPQVEPEDPGNDPGESGGESETAAITSIVYNNDTALTRFSCGEDGRWFWTDDVNFPLDQSYVLRILELLADISDVAATKTAGEDTEDGAVEEDQPDYGLSDSHRTLTVTDSDRQETVYQVGSCVDGILYLGLLNEEQTGGTVCCASGELMDALSRNIFSMAILPTMPELTMENVQSVKLGGGSSGEIILQGSEKGWIHAGNDVTEQVTALLAALSALQVESCVDFAPSAGVAALCGLDQPRAVVGVSYTNEVSKTAELSVCVGGARDGGGVFITLNGEDTVYQVSESAVQPLINIVNSDI